MGRKKGNSCAQDVESQALGRGAPLGEALIGEKKPLITKKNAFPEKRGEVERNPKSDAILEEKKG